MLETCQDIRDIFVEYYSNNRFAEDGNLEIIGARFMVTDNKIFGKPNEKYNNAEFKWYMNQNLNVNNLGKEYGFVPKMWLNIAGPNGYINSNYGWAAFSKANYSQFAHAYNYLSSDKNSRRAILIYTRPDIHETKNKHGANDMFCLNYIHFFIRDNKLMSIVSCRSNDAVYGFNADLNFQLRVMNIMFSRLQHYIYPDLEMGYMIWQADTLHIYPRHFYLIDNYLTGKDNG